MQIADVDAQQRDRIAASEVYDRVIAHLTGDALHIFEVADRGCSRQVDGVACGGPDREVGDRVVVAAVGEDEQVVAGATFKSVVTVTAGENVIVIPADQDIVAACSPEF